jgi:hypothetical protein
MLSRIKLYVRHIANLRLIKYVIYSILKKIGAITHKLMIFVRVDNFYLYFGSIQCILLRYINSSQFPTRSFGAIVYTGQPRGFAEIANQILFLQKYFDIFITLEANELNMVKSVAAEKNLNIHIIITTPPKKLSEKLGAAALQYYKWKCALEHIQLSQKRRKVTYEILIRHRTDYYLWFPALLPLMVKLWKPGIIYCNGDQCFGGRTSTMLQMKDLWEYSLEHHPWHSEKLFDVNSMQILRSDDVYCWWFINLPTRIVGGVGRQSRRSVIRNRLFFEDTIMESQSWQGITVMKRSKGFPSQKVFALYINKKDLEARLSLLWLGTLRQNRK